MARSMSVTFSDGTSHTYDDVPDGVSQEQINMRVRTDYPDKEVSGISAGAAPEAPKPPPPSREPSFGENVLGGAQTAFGVGNALLNTPVGHFVEAGAAGAAGKKYLLDPLLEALKARGAVSPTASTGPQIHVPESVGGGPRPVAPTPGTPAQTAEALTRNYNPASQAAQAEVAAGRGAAQGAAQTAGSGMNRFAQLGARFAPVAAVPAAIAAGGGYLTNAAANTLRGMTPEARDMMQGDVGSDTAFAAAILNSAAKQQEIDNRIRQAAAQKALRPVAPVRLGNQG